MNNRIEESFEELDYNLQKTSFPRPAELGELEFGVEIYSDLQKEAIV